ncbi:DNA polymerase [Lizard adenovirus 2]|uniref:DNA polymerase n=9 Tax=Barthadenovirus TaxID=3152491 RepID=A0A076FTA6_9ADEN|nr:DNA polymerase [Lizard adenovirus 2]AII22563.1 DNA polymerase [Lizard adenovirus 2]
MERSATTVKSRSTHYVCGYHENVYLKIIFYKNTNLAVKNYLQLHAENPFCSIPDVLNPSFFEKLKKYPSSFREWHLLNSQLQLTEKPLGGDGEPFSVLYFRGQQYVIKSIAPQNRCEDCGKNFSSMHNCNFRRREFYHHAILPDTKTWWKPIKFSPLGSLESAKRLFIVYDIETYTQHSEYGKQLVPYLLVLKLKGDKPLCSTAENIALACGFSKYRGCLMLLNKSPDFIGHKFKEMRLNLQKAAASETWKEYKNRHNLEKDYTFEELKNLQNKNLLNLDAQPSFTEITVIGHNICGFDEIVLASHVLEGLSKDEEFSMFRITRNFMPRAGKLLFNDISMALPNPTYKKPDKDTFERWKLGCLLPQDVKTEGVKFMVRDTFLLTHSSLRNAAAAYQLEVSKGHCPYEAVNQYFMTGTYLCEENLYPAKQYWSSEKEYLENMPKSGEKYDIVQKALDYCVDDVLVTVGLVKKLVSGYQLFCQETLQLECCFNVFQRPTISSTTHAMFKQMFYKSEVSSCSKYLPNIQAPSEIMYEHIRQSVRGGRCYPSFLGVYTEPIYVYDICGMYASALSHPMPYGLTLSPLDASVAMARFQDKLESTGKLSFFDKDILPMIVKADCFPPPLYHLDVLPPLCSKKSGRLCWTNEPLLGEVLTTVDIIILHNRGWRVKILQGSETYAVWPEWKPLCREYVSINIAAKEKADKEKNQTQRSISKLLSNALYGSFATRLDNKQVVFMEDMSDTTEKDLKAGKATIVSMTSVSSRSLPKKDISFWDKYFNLPQVEETNASNLNEETENSAFIGREKDHVTFKPITFLSAECDNLLLATVQSNSDWVKNERYATQIASFVLAWSRAFMSEWASILYEEDMGIPYEKRTVKSVYGDTDSLFLTEKGHELMLTKGKHRLKSSGNSLVYKDDDQLAWLVECETVCNNCRKDAYSSESCFLAPKLYALKDTTCPSCLHVSSGKLRAKGHAKSCISYDLLKHCFLDYYFLEKPTENYQSERTSIKRTLVNATWSAAPFSVVEKQLIRVIRPWTDMTMVMGPVQNQGFLLFPYDQKRPNPRPQEPLQENPFWEDS